VNILEFRTQSDRVELYKQFVKLPLERKRKTLRWLYLDETKGYFFTQAVQEYAEKILTFSESVCVTEFKNQICKQLDYLRDGNLNQQAELMDKFQFCFEDELFTELDQAVAVP
jgi:hypothetical protein